MAGVRQDLSGPVFSIWERGSFRKVRVFRGKQPVSVQQSEAEDDQHTQVCGLEIENISSTSVFIL